MKLLKKEPPDIQQPKKQGGLKELKANVFYQLIQQFSIKYENIKSF